MMMKHGSCNEGSSIRPTSKEAIQALVEGVNENGNGSSEGQRTRFSKKQRKNQRPACDGDKEQLGLELGLDLL
ncbi:hypothetical protein V6N11_030605 [Hibiscus sabdariffa]|uniref:Uncharacterized protein n=1 Tax=Hibiscus sabdariffa TaxID=183260 RepID=A0ABR1Z6A8_9ROSI